MPIEALRLSGSAKSILHRNGIHNIAQLRGLSDIQLLGLTDFTAGILGEVKSRLAAHPLVGSSGELLEPLANSLSEFDRTAVLDLGLSHRTLNCLHRHGIYNVAQLQELSDEQLLALRQFGRNMLAEVRMRLASHPPAVLSTNRVESTPGSAVDWGDETVFALGLSSRALNALRHSGINSIAELECLSDEQLLAFRSIGQGLLSEIRAKMATARASTLQRTPVILNHNELESAGSGFVLPTTARLLRDSRKSLGLSHADLATRVGVQRKLALAWELEEMPVLDALIPCLARVLNVPTTALSDNQQLVGPPTSHSVSLAVMSLCLDERQWTTIKYRFGFTERLTLDSVGALIGVTRERARQIEHRTQQQLAESTGILGSIFCVLNAAFPSVSEVLKGKLDPSELIGLAQSVFQKDDWGDAEAESIERLFVAVRALVAAGLEGVTLRASSTAAVCALKPLIRQHPDVSSILARENTSHGELKKSTYESIAEAILARNGRPLHFGEIADIAESSGMRLDVNRSTLLNTLASCSGRFVRVGQGTYALAVWGIAQPRYYAAIISDVLRRNGRPMSVGAVRQAVEAERPIKTSTLKMTLDMDPAFYLSPGGTYGLREWLPPRDKQTLYTPSWQIETAESYARIKKHRVGGSQR